MMLPPLNRRPDASWPRSVRERWDHLLAQAQELKAAAGQSEAFEQMVARLRALVSTGRVDGLQSLLSHRLAARALTWLWLHDEVIGRRLLTVPMLNRLVAAQHPRLTRITLLQLVQVYFRRFDLLDACDPSAEQSVRDTVEAHLRAQVRLLPDLTQHTPAPDALTTLKREGHWMLSLDGPLTLAQRIRAEGKELTAMFTACGLSGFDTGRYGDVCRAHFYLDTLRQLAPGVWHEVLDELLKPAASHAPYEGNKRIGHAALEILIDRSGDVPGDAWLHFILSLAGDPRIASTAPNYREWWLPLGEARINRVRSWLSREDLRLFLQAVEQYGKESSNAELQRMFPQRKRFLEGLFEMGRIRYTRLMLGGKAQQSVKRMLGNDIQTSFARLDGSMSNTAVLYLDCGDFHLVEGSHSFKIWVYLAQPGPVVKSYDHTVFTHTSLTSMLPRQYEQLYPGLGYTAVTHNGMWQRKVLDFLADKGITIDIEQLVSQDDYAAYRSRRYGVPLAKASTVQRAKLPEAQEVPVRGKGDQPISIQEPLVRQLLMLGPFELRVLQYFVSNPGDRVRAAANILRVEAQEINRVLYGPLRNLCTQSHGYGWSVPAGVMAALKRLSMTT
ncbi:MAG: EH signature domain-containing protein [Candidatus Tectimicrobiota bacterium]